MGRVLSLFALLGAICLGAFALADELTPRASETPKSPTVPSAPESLSATQPDGSVGDVNGEAKAKQQKVTAKRERKSKPVLNERAKDKYKASQSGNDATFRQLPSPAQRGSE